MFVSIGIGQNFSQNNVQTKLANPDPRQILKESADACLKIKSIKYIFEHTPANKNNPMDYQYEATIQQERSAVPSLGFLPGKFVLSVDSGLVKDEKSNSVAFAYDGSIFRVLDPIDKVINVMKSPSAYNAGSLVGTFGIVSLAGMTQFTDEKPFIDQLEKSDNIEYSGTTEIKGVECHIISITSTIEHPAFGKKTINRLWFIGVNDKLPYGTEFKGSRDTVRNIEINTAFNDSDFVLKTPSGYGERLVTGTEPKRKGLLTIGSDAPNWTLTDPQNVAHSLIDYRGKLVVLDFWGTWCGPCMATMPVIQSIHEKFKDKRVVVLGISVADSEGDPALFMKNKGFTYGLLTKGDAVATDYKAEILPTLYLINGKGKIIYAEYGFRKDAKEELIQFIERYLKSVQN